MKPEVYTQADVLRLSLREQVRQKLLRRILNGEYAPDERLVESRLAEEFKVSAAPIREALRELEALGFVMSLPHRGVRVRALRSDELAEVYPVRAALEETAAKLAAGKLDKFDRELEAAIVGMEETAVSGDVESYVQYSVAFHRTLVQAAENRLLIGVWNSLGIEVRTLVSVVTRVADLSETARSHRPILEALRVGNSTQAAKLAREHVEHVGRRSPSVCG